MSLFEPIHGSAPKYKGQNVANPVASILAVALMLEHLGHREASASIEAAVSRMLRDETIQSLSAGVQSTSEIGDLVAQALA